MIWKTVSQHLKLVGRSSQATVRNIYTSKCLRKNLYEVLEVPRDATQVEIKNAYFELSKMYHPDRIAATDENLARFREISAAYEILGNEQSRKLYDRGLLGEFKRPGGETTEEITDPIIKFYKKRQEMSKSMTKAEDLQAWVQPSKKFSKSTVSQKYNYFRKGHVATFETTFENYWYLLAVMLISGFFFKDNFESKPLLKPNQEV